MKKAMESLQDLIEEAKTRTIYWALCIFAVSYFLTHTSKAMLMNIPIAVLLVSGLRILFNKVEFRWKVHNARPLSYLSHLEKKQSSPNDSRLSTVPPPSKWKRNINSPAVEAAMQDFIKKLLQDFVVNLWYSDITPDKEVPELIHAIIMDVLGEVSGRVKEVNLVELLTRDVVDLIGEHLDLFRRNQAAIGVDVMGTLSSEKRDERLKHHLLVSKELHPALISSECEYKVLQRLMSGLLAVVLRPREAQCPLVRCIARELLTCLVMEPIMNFASPVREDNIAQGIRWIQDVIWPDGTFFRPLSTRTELECQENERFQLTMRQQGQSSVSKPGTFEEQLEASRRARDVEKIIFNGAPATLVSLIGQKQYRRCARDVYYFLQVSLTLPHDAHTC
ncbi:Intermediate filament [Olea europaea subsp. europaea]|uniref:Intermediate filament n=1 Tax=Olea europaea subsp. europaea TaxID=158383 RepID=A0A8S0UD73_OLEEU|nr:Intermediate filament [Olea europaea subsp. europaea]